MSAAPELRSAFFDVCGNIPLDLENFSVRKSNKSVRFIRFYIVLMIFRDIRVYTNYVRPYDVVQIPWYRYSTTINAEALDTHA